MYKVNASKVKELQKKYFTEDEPTEVVVTQNLFFSALQKLGFKPTYISGLVITRYENDYTYGSNYIKTGEWLWEGKGLKFLVCTYPTYKDVETYIVISIPHRRELMKLVNNYLRLIGKNKSDKFGVIWKTPLVEGYKEVDYNPGSQFTPPSIAIKSKKIGFNKVSHPAYINVKNDIEYYLNNVKKFTRYGQSGIRKAILIGEPGTGKTSIFYKLADDFKAKVMSTFPPIETLMLLCEKSNKQGIPLLLFLDDCDSFISQSVFMSFLDGNLSMRTKYGIYFVLATNNPKKIDPRIIKRPGRIDLIEIVGSVEGNFLADIFDIHLAYKIPNIRERIAEFGKMTGAQVKEVLQRSYQFAAQTDQKLSVDLLLNVKAKLFELLTDKFDETEYESLYGQREPIGFKSVTEAILNKEVMIKGFGR